MKPYITTEITTMDSAYKLYDQLAKDGMLFHPEDDPATVIQGSTGESLFTDEEAAMLRLRIAEAYRFIPDPCGYCLGLSDGGTAPDRWKERSRTYQGVADAMAQQ